jgi:hypothetical protein
MQQLIISDHAYQRAAQRNVSEDEIYIIVQHGHRVRKAGAIFCQFRRNSLPELDARLEALIGTTVMLCKCGSSVITLYRNERAFKRDRRKSKYDMTPSSAVRCPNCSDDTALSEKDSFAA